MRATYAGILLLCILEVNAQGLPILTQPLKKGIYTRFDEFKFNLPSITDSFYVDTKPRNTEVWEGTYSSEIRFVESDKKVKRVWGYCDGKDVFIFHQIDYFKVKIDRDSLGFFGYGIIDSQGTAAAGVIGGAIGGGVYAAIALSNAKNKKDWYFIDWNSGELQQYKTSHVITTKDDRTARLILYRGQSKEINNAISVVINDTLSLKFPPQSYYETMVPLGDKPIKMCLDENTCEDFTIVTVGTSYFEVSSTKKQPQPVIRNVDVKTGKYYATQAKYDQEKRITE